MKPTQDQIHVASLERKRLNRVYYDVLGENGAKEIMEDLERVFNLRSMVKRVDGKVDVNATLVNNGAFEVLQFIKGCINFGAKNE